MSLIHSQFAQHMGRRILHDGKEYILDGVRLSHLEVIDEWLNKYAFTMDDCKIIVKNVEEATVEGYNSFLCVVKAKRKYISVLEKEMEEKEERIIEQICTCSGITRKKLLLERKTKEKKEVWARQIHLAFRQLILNLGPSEAALVYNQNHATALWAKRQIINLIETDKAWMEIYKPSFDSMIEEFGDIVIERFCLQKYYAKSKKCLEFVGSKEKVL